MAESIEIPFGLLIQVDPGNQFVVSSPVPPWKGAILRGKDMP